MHPKLIRANIALFQGARTEVQLLLQEYQHEQGQIPEDDPHAGMVMWLDAHAQNDREERISRLNTLIALRGDADYYSHLAEAYLQDEKAKIKSSETHSGITLGGVPLWKSLVLVILGGVITFIGLNVFNANRENLPQISGEVTAATTVGQVQPTLLPDLPDRSRVLVADSYTARYPEGILQVAAVEDDSARIVDNQGVTLVTPVPGARLYAVKIIFECRAGICEAPPQAELAVRLDNGDMIEARQGVAVAGEQMMQPIALGRTTTGWAIFEIPVSSPVNALIIMPLENKAEGDAEPIVLEIS